MFCGTPSYMSPEITHKQAYSGSACDMWAVGVAMYTMLTGVPPFKDETEKGLFRKIQRGSYPEPVNQ